MVKLKIQRYFQIDIGRVFLFLLMTLWLGNCFAADILQGLDVDAMDTLGGTGKTLIYLAEAVVATITYVKSRNIMVFVGTAVVFIAFNFLFKMIGT